MVFDLGSIRAVLDLDDTSYERGILNAQALNNAFGQSFADAITNPVVFGIGKLREFAGAAVSLGQDILATAEEVQRLGNQTGITTDTIQALRAEFELAGRNAEVADRAMRNFSTRLGQARQGSGTLGDSLRQVGLTLEDLPETTDGAFRVLVDRLGEISDQNQANAVSARAFGEEAGPKLLETVGPSLDEVIRRQQSLGQILREGSIASLADLNTILGEFQQVAGGVLTLGLAEFITSFADGTRLAESNVEDLGDRLQDDILPAAQQLGEAVARIAGDLSDIGDAPALDRLLELVQGINVLLGNGNDVTTRSFIQEVLAGFGLDTTSTSLPAFEGSAGQAQLRRANRAAQERERERSLNR